jgi:hypothetical protein
VRVAQLCQFFGKNGTAVPDGSDSTAQSQERPRQQFDRRHLVQALSRVVRHTPDLRPSNVFSQHVRFD